MNPSTQPKNPDTESEVIRLLLVDDHPLFLHGLEALLNLEPELEVVATATHGKEALARYREHKPDMVLLDMQMPEMDGPSFLHHLREEFPDAHAIMLSTFDREEDLIRSLDAGASGYLLKDENLDALLDAIRRTLKGEIVLPTRLSSRATSYLMGEQLSDREKEVLGRLADGLRNREIGDKLGIREATVKIHLHSAYRKLDVRNRAEALIKVRSLGLV